MFLFRLPFLLSIHLPLSQNAESFYADFTARVHRCIKYLYLSMLVKSVIQTSCDSPEHRMENSQVRNRGIQDYLGRGGVIWDQAKISEVPRETR